jgi:hypothetical protein
MPTTTRFAWLERRLAGKEHPASRKAGPRTDHAVPVLVRAARYGVCGRKLGGTECVGDCGNAGNEQSEQDGRPSYTGRYTEHHEDSRADDGSHTDPDGVEEP